MSIYKELPYLENADLPSCRYAKASEIRDVLRHAINTARALPESQMDEVDALLEFAITHIRSVHDEEVSLFDEVAALEADLAITSDDPLDGLCGPAETFTDARIG